MSYFSKADEARLRRLLNDAELGDPFTAADRAKLESIATGATVGATWNVNITDQPDLSVASYSNLLSYFYSQ